MIIILFCFGLNQYGVLGVGDTKPRYEPVKVGYGDCFHYIKDRPLQDVVAGTRHSFIRDSMGQYWGFGNNFNCVLGHGSDDVRRTNIYQCPIKLDRVGGIEKLDSNFEHSVAISKSDSIVYTWGFNFYGQLGIGNIENSCEPRNLTSTFGDVGGLDVAAGQCHTLVTLTNGTAYGMGCNVNYQLGGGYQDNYLPVEITFPKSEFIFRVAASITYSIFLTMNGDVYFTGEIDCWYFLEKSAFNKTKEFVQTHTTLIFDHNEYGKAITIRAGVSHFIVQMQSGRLYGFGCNELNCLGENNLKYDNFQIVELDVSKVTSSDVISDIDASNRMSAILTEKGHIFVLGNDLSLPLFDNENQTSFGEFTQISDPDVHFTSISLSNSHLLSLTNDSHMYGWGDNYNTQCGKIPPQYLSSFQMIKNNEFERRNVTDIQVSTMHAIAVSSSDGVVYAFGDGSYGQLGTGSFKNENFPTFMDLQEEKYHRVVDSSASDTLGFLTCELGDVLSFGTGEFGGLGCGELSIYLSPREIPQDLFLGMKIWNIESKKEHIHAVSSEGNVFSWGSGLKGELGLGEEKTFSKVPVMMDKEVISHVTDLAVGTTCTIVMISSDKRESEGENEIWFWGTISLANDNYDKPVFEPERVEFNFTHCDEVGDNCGKLNGVLSCGNDWCVVVVDGKYLYLWGYVSYKEQQYQYETPTLYWTAPYDIAVCRSELHTVCVLVNGEVYGMGRNDYNQLLQGKDVKFTFEFRKLDSEWFYDTKFSKVALSQFSTILLESVRCKSSEGMRLDSDMNVCSRHGTCVAEDDCLCYHGYSGEICNKVTCDGIPEDDPFVCNGNGTCMDIDTCKCNDTWSNYNQDRTSDQKGYGYCKFPICPVFQSMVCGGHGFCTLVSRPKNRKGDYEIIPSCECDPKYMGDSCQLPNCRNSTDRKDLIFFPESEDEDLDSGCGNFGRCVLNTQGWNYCECVTEGLNALLPIGDNTNRDKPQVACSASASKVAIYVLLFCAIMLCCYICCYAGCCCCVCSSVCLGKRYKQITHYNGISRTITFVNGEYVPEEYLDREDFEEISEFGREDRKAYIRDGLSKKFWRKHLEFESIPLLRPTRDFFFQAFVYERTDQIVNKNRVNMMGSGGGGNNETKVRKKYIKKNRKKIRKRKGDFFATNELEYAMEECWGDVRYLKSNTRSRIVFHFTGYCDDENSYYTNDSKIMIEEIMDPFMRSLELVITSFGSSEKERRTKTVDFLFVFDTCDEPEKIIECFDSFFKTHQLQLGVFRNSANISVEIIATNGKDEFWREFTKVVREGKRGLTRVLYPVSEAVAKLQDILEIRDQKSYGKSKEKRISSLNEQQRLGGEDDPLLLERPGEEGVKVINISSGEEEENNRRRKSRGDRIYNRGYRNVDRNDVPKDDDDDNDNDDDDLSFRRIDDSDDEDQFSQSIRVCYSSKKWNPKSGFKC